MGGGFLRGLAYVALSLMIMLTSCHAVFNRDAGATPETEAAE